MTADLILGCDGVKSLVRDLVVGEPTSAVATGDAAYRAIIPTSEMLKDPALKELVESPEMTGWMGPGRHIMGYCIVCCSSHCPNSLSLTSGISVQNGNTTLSWRIPMMALSNPGPRKAALTRCALTSRVGNQGTRRGHPSSFDHILIQVTRITKLLSMVPSTLKWKLMDRQPLVTWLHHEGRVVLLGDSCHPMLVNCTMHNSREEMSLMSCTALPSPGSSDGCRRRGSPRKPPFSTVPPRRTHAPPARLRSLEVPKNLGDAEILTPKPTHFPPFGRASTAGTRRLHAHCDGDRARAREQPAALQALDDGADDDGLVGQRRGEAKADGGFQRRGQFQPVGGPAQEL